MYFDKETNLCYNRFRYYSPEVGNYISQDPIRLHSGEPDFYAYVNNPNSLVDIFGLECKPKQVHHYATNKSKKWTGRMKKIARKYGLDLDGDWNKESLSHQGRHPDQYHDFVLKQMEKADAIASKAPKGTKKKVFVEEFEKRVKDPVRENPDLLYKIGWE